MKKTVVLSIVYPAVERYLLDFFDSLSNQKDQDFDVYLINDRLNNIEFYKKKYSSLKITIKNMGGSPALLRKAGIEWVLKNNFDIIVFADADDYFSENRIALSKLLLNHNDIVCNELVLFGDSYPSQISYLGNHFQERNIICNKDIYSGNCLGLSNTALNTTQITDINIEVPENLVAFDWLFYSHLLLKDKRAIFTREIKTFYRQHNSNIGNFYLITDEQILHGVNVKRIHYHTLSPFDNWYREQAMIFQNLYQRLYDDIHFKGKYCNALRIQMPAFPLWWECIKSPEELRI